jgi:hypothetical protein
VAAWLTAGICADIGGASVEVRYEIVPANYAHVLRLKAFRGRWFVPEEDSPASEPVLVITHRFGETKLHADRAAVGRLICISRSSPFEFRNCAAGLLRDGDRFLETRQYVLRQSHLCQ